MGMGFAPTWICQVSPPPPLHKTTLTIGCLSFNNSFSSFPVSVIISSVTVSQVEQLDLCVLALLDIKQRSLRQRMTDGEREKERGEFV